MNCLYINIKEKRRISTRHVMLTLTTYSVFYTMQRFTWVNILLSVVMKMTKVILINYWSKLPQFQSLAKQKTVLTTKGHITLFFALNASVISIESCYHTRRNIKLGCCESFAIVMSNRDISFSEWANQREVCNRRPFKTWLTTLRDSQCSIVSTATWISLTLGLGIWN